MPIILISNITISNSSKCKRTQNNNLGLPVNNAVWPCSCSRQYITTIFQFYFPVVDIFIISFCAFKRASRY